MSDLKNLKGPTPNPYFAQRVLAELEGQKQRRLLMFWKFLAGGSLVLGSLLSFHFYNLGQHGDIQYATAPANKLIVLQLDEVPQDARIAYVTLVIDSDMSFQISDPDLATKKELTLAIDPAEKNKRLPFVFLSHVKGKKIVKVKFLDSDFNLVKEDQHYIDFSESKKGEI